MKTALDERIGAWTSRSRKAMRVAIPLLLLCALAAGCAANTRSQASCAGPTLQENPSRVAPGEAFELRGKNFFIGCNDTGQRETMPPDKNIRLAFRQEGKTWELSTVDANSKYAFSAELEVPSGAHPGPAALIADSGSGRTKEPFFVLPAHNRRLSSSEPPESTLAHGRKSVIGELGTYCWGDGCSDSAGVIIPQERRTLTVPVGSTLEFGFGGEERLTSVSARATPLDQPKKLTKPDSAGISVMMSKNPRSALKSEALKVRREGDRVLIPASLSPGEYAVYVFIRVAEGGDAAYHYRVLVKPESDESPTSKPMPGREVFFPQQEPGTDAMLSELNGKLILDHKGCLRVRAFGNQSTVPVWRSDLKLDTTGGEVRILDQKGRTLAEVGEKVYMAGGSVGRSFGDIDAVNESLKQKLPERCPGKYWLVGFGVNMLRGE